MGVEDDAAAVTLAFIVADKSPETVTTGVAALKLAFCKAPKSILS